jgi:hypothetical protein
MLYPIILPDENRYQKKDWTVFVLSLSLNETGLEDLKRSLATIEGDILIFLHRLQRLTLSFDSTFISYSSERTDDDVVTIIRSSREQPETATKYSVHEIEWEFLSLHPKLNTHFTTTKLAFPLPSSRTSPILANQHIYAFLPLRRTSFAVHAS